MSAAFAELRSALSEGDREAAFHALVHELTDMLYVAYGALVAFGVEADDVLRRFTGQTCGKYPALSVRTENN